MTEPVQTALSGFYFMHANAIERCRNLPELIKEAARLRRPMGRKITKAEKEAEIAWVEKKERRLKKAFDFMFTSQCFPPPVIIDHHLLIGFHVEETTYDFGRHTIKYTPEILAKLIGHADWGSVTPEAWNFQQLKPKNMHELETFPHIYVDMANHMLAQKLMEVEQVKAFTQAQEARIRELMEQKDRELMRPPLTPIVPRKKAKVEDEEMNSSLIAPSLIQL